MWWNKKKEEMKPELTKEQVKKNKILTDAKDTLYNKTINAINVGDIELANRWFDLFEKIKSYKYNW